MTTPLRVLIVEDCEDDALLIQRELRRGGLELAVERADCREAMRAVLDQEKCDIVLCDYSMPTFSAPEALVLWKETGQDIPFIVISGTVGEEVAVEIMRAGAHDYFMKDNLTRLVPAVNRELQEAQERRRRRQAEQELHEATLQWAATFDAMEDSVAIVDAESRFRRCNRATMKLLGKPADEIVGRTCCELVHGTSGPIEDCPMVRMRQSRRREVLELTLGDRWYNVTVDPIFDDSGEILGAVHLVSDITDRKRRIDELRRAKEAAEAADSAKDEFLAKMSHELRTPLNAIIGFSEGLLDRANVHPLNDHQMDRITRILDSGRHLLDLINELLDIAKIEAGKTELSTTSFELPPLAGEIARVTESLVMNEPYLDFSLQLADALPPIESDREKIKAILLNLVSNAVKFTSRGSVVLRIQQDPGGVAISVTDTGIGIPADQLDRIFQRFTQVNGASASPMRGTGLGLPIAKSLAETLGGTLTAVSTEGQGSTFTLSLPLTPPADAETDVVTAGEGDDHAGTLVETTGSDRERT